MPFCSYSQNLSDKQSSFFTDMGHTHTDTHSIVLAKTVSEPPAEGEKSYRSMDFQGNKEETSFEFWPVQHPTEPLEEDRPVQCPLPIHADSQHKLSERSSAAFNREKRLDRVLPTRKRHHGEQRMTDHHLMGRHSLDQLLPPPPRNFTMFQMLNKFNS